jgi:hypothetical protein
MNLKHFIVAILAALTGFLSVQSIAAEEQRRTPVLIAGVQEPDEMRVEPLPTNKLDLSAPERMLGSIGFEPGDLIMRAVSNFDIFCERGTPR